MLLKTVFMLSILHCSGVRAYPSVKLKHDASVEAKTLASAELKHMIQDTISQTLKDLLLTTTPMPDPVSKEDIVSVATSWQLSAVQNLTKYLEDLVKGVNNLVPPSTTPAPMSAYNKRFESIEQTLQNLTESVKRLETKELTASTTPITPICGLVSGYEYSSVTKRCYKLHTEDSIWTAADAICSNEHGHLVVINNPEEARYLGDISRKISKNIFVGIYRNTAGQWMTVSGDTVLQSAAGYNVWGAGEPYIEGKWRFASINSDGKVISRTETENYPFICEKAP